MGKIIIFGLGFVGITLAIFLASKNQNVIGVDIDKKKIQELKKGISPIYEPRIEHALKKALMKRLVFTNKIEKISKDDIVFVTVGTPSKKDGSIDLKFIKSVSKKIVGLIKNMSNLPLVVIKSTILPGTFEDTIKPIFIKNSISSKNIVINPEFLREGSALEDTLHPHQIVIGGERKTAKTLEKFYRKIYSNKVPIEISNHITAELIKYANNSFLATKISFINSIANLCQTLPGTNIDQIARSIGRDPRIGSLFLNAGPGYGGSCFPKDVKALISLIKKRRVGSDLLISVHKTNLNQVKIVLRLISKYVKPLKNSSISILGLAFKENSDDIRESVSIKLIKKLLKNHVKVKVHDPKAMKNVEKVFGKKITYYKHPEDCLKNSNCAIILTSWKQYFSLSNKEFSKMKTPILIDTRRILAGKKINVKYIGLGIGE